MTKYYLTTFLILRILTVFGQNCEWSLVKVNSDTVYFLSKPIDIGEKLTKEKILLQGMIIGSNRLLILNVKNEAIMTTDKIAVKSKTGDLVTKAIDVDTRMLIAKSTAVFSDPAGKPSEKRTLFSDLESKENRFTFFEITTNDIKNFKKAEFISFQATDIAIELPKSTAKRLRTLIGCLE